MRSTRRVLGAPRRRRECPSWRPRERAKYAEIREAELDHRTGKLSDEDYEAVDGALRAEAIEILDVDELDELAGRIRRPALPFRGA